MKISSNIICLQQITSMSSVVNRPWVTVPINNIAGFVNHQFWRWVTVRFTPLPPSESKPKPWVLRSAHLNIRFHRSATGSVFPATAAPSLLFCKEMGLARSEVTDIRFNPAGSGSQLGFEASSDIDWVLPIYFVQSNTGNWESENLPYQR